MVNNRIKYGEVGVYSLVELFRSTNPIDHPKNHKTLVSLSAHLYFNFDFIKMIELTKSMTLFFALNFEGQTYHEAEKVLQCE